MAAAGSHWRRLVSSGIVAVSVHYLWLLAHFGVVLRLPEDYSMLSAEMQSHFRFWLIDYGLIQTLLWTAIGWSFKRTRPITRT
ncbi:MAG: hypothetical protein HYY24_15280 [Verrucomicrobia bacterium]|nr:hypothetical protein [Verrucomicrobiota bacterium]